MRLKEHKKRPRIELHIFKQLPINVEMMKIFHGSKCSSLSCYNVMIYIFIFLTTNQKSRQRRFPNAYNHSMNICTIFSWIIQMGLWVLIVFDAWKNKEIYPQLPFKCQMLLWFFRERINVSIYRGDVWQMLATMQIENILIFQ